jgi:hypothetical protein
VNILDLIAMVLDQLFEIFVLCHDDTEISVSEKADR